MCQACDEENSAGPHRRDVLRLSLTGLGLLGAASLMSGPALADECLAFGAEAQAATTPDQAITMLVEGNARFASGQSLKCDLLAQAKATAEEQTPFACVLGCIDSRVAPELVFDQQIGDIFVGRVAGNVPTTELIGSFEYAAAVAGVKAIVVLGHNHCGGIKGAVDKADVGGNLTALLNEIEPIVAATPLEGERSSKNHPFVQAVAEANVRAGVQKLTAASPVLAKLVEEAKLKIVGAMYDLETDKVTFLA